MSINSVGGFNANWFTYKPIDPSGKVRGNYAIIKPEHRKDVENFYASQREEFLQETRELQATVNANGSVKLTDDQKAALSEKYDPADMSREDYISFVDDLYEYGILNGDDRDHIQARADGLIMVLPGATHVIQGTDNPYRSTHFEDCGGNVLNWAGYMASFEYFDELIMDFAPTKSALLFGKIGDVLKQI
ncbi:MAG: hypothetical protein IJC39_04850 [Firmicutes bacterium]|nr:hypothetical protein [Bacillota bacterium]